MLKYKVDEDKVTIYHKQGEIVLTDATVVGNMITGNLNGVYIDICLTPERNNFYYGVYRDGNRLQLEGV